jgi:hypothetical protein
LVGDAQGIVEYNFGGGELCLDGFGEDEGGGFEGVEAELEEVARSGLVPVEDF